MKAMQDKDFDRLFAGKLGELDEEPSAHVWENIAGKINPPKRRRPWLSIAASVLLVLSAGVFILRKTHPETNMVQQQNMRKPLPEKTEAAQPELFSPLKTDDQAQQLASAPAPHHTPAKPENRRIAQQKNRGEKSSLPAQDITREPLLAAASTVASPAMDLQSAGTAIEPVSRQPTLSPIKEVLASRMQKKQPINSIGDLVNLVVAKVDKREDKVIEFKDEDGQSTVSSVNLGIILIRKN